MYPYYFCNRHAEEDLAKYGVGVEACNATNGRRSDQTKTYPSNVWPPSYACTTCRQIAGSERIYFQRFGWQGSSLPRTRNEKKIKTPLPLGRLATSTAFIF